jgi:hypothetical protein
MVNNIYARISPFLVPPVHQDRLGKMNPGRLGTPESVGHYSSQGKHQRQTSERDSPDEGRL